MELINFAPKRYNKLKYQCYKIKGSLLPLKYFNYSELGSN